MIGVTLFLKCKHCGAEESYNIGSTKCFHLNKTNIDYLPIRCEKCGMLHYVATPYAYRVKEMSQQAKELAYAKMKILLGNSQSTKAKFLEEAQFVLESDAVLSEQEVTDCKEVGAIAF